MAAEVPENAEGKNISAEGNAPARVLEAARWIADGAGRHYQALFVAVLIVLLLLPLQTFPGNFTDFPKMFWGYDALIRGYTGARFSLIQDRIFGDTFTAPGPWMVYTGEGSLDDYQNTHPFTTAELARIQQNLDGLNERLSAKDIHFLVVIVPGKNTIYPEYMPRQVPVIGSESRTDQILAYQKAHGQAEILDLRPALRAARQQRQVYYATDTHWNQYGILAGYMEILKALQKDFPNLQPHTLADFKPVSEGPGSGDLSEEWVQGLAQEEMVKLEPRFNRDVTRFSLTQGTAQVPGRMAATFNPDPALPRAVIFHDSFFNEMIPFLSDHFSWAVYHWAFKVDETFVAGEKPDIVIFEVTDRYLSRLLAVTQ